MSDHTESMWPKEIRASVQSPSSILMAQAKALTKQTNGVLIGRVTFGLSEDDVVLLNLSIMVPELDHYQHHLMVVQHRKDMPYPAVVDAELFRATGLVGLQTAMKALRATSWFPLAEPANGLGAKKPDNRADSDTEFIELVAKVFRSPYVVSVAQSLITRAAEVRAEKESSVTAASTQEAPDSSSDAK